MMSCWLFAVFQVVLDVLDPEDTVSCLLSLLHRVDLSAAEQWSVNFTHKIIVLSSYEALTTVFMSCSFLLWPHGLKQTSVELI